MTWVWLIFGFVLLAALAGGVFMAVQNPAWIVGVATEVVKKLLPNFEITFGDNKVTLRRKRMVDKWGPPH